MKGALLKLIGGNGARIRVAITSIIIGGATWLVQRLGFENGPEWSTALATIATTASGWVMDSIAAKLSSDGVKEIQRILPQPLVEDGMAGQKTIDAVQATVDAALPFNTTPNIIRHGD